MKRALSLAVALVVSGCVFWRTASLEEVGEKTVFTYSVRAAGYAVHAGEMMKQKDVIVLTMIGKKDVYRDGEVQATLDGVAQTFHGTVAIDRAKKKLTIKSRTPGSFWLPDGTYGY